MSKTEANTLPAPAFEDSKHHIKIYQGDCLDILAKIPEDTVDLVFAAVFPLERRDYLPRRADGQRQQRRVGQIARRGRQS